MNADVHFCGMWVDFIKFDKSFACFLFYHCYDIDSQVTYTVSSKMLITKYLLTLHLIVLTKEEYNVNIEQLIKSHKIKLLYIVN